MKKFNFLNNAATSLLVVSMSLFLFTGCQSKNTQNTSDKTAKVNFSAEDMKKKMQDNINSLVTEGTINQSQADKVLEALSTNKMFSGQRKPQSGQPNNQQNYQSNNQQTGQSNSNGSNNPNRQRANPLSKLVTDGVITQEQADAIMQKVRGNFGRPQGN